MRSWSVVGFLLAASCQTDDSIEATGRAAGERAPLSAACDEADPYRCLLPWPSNTYTVPDPTTATGLRLALDATGILSDDDLDMINRADGFSRLSPIVTAFPGELDPESVAGALQVFNAQPNHVAYGQPVELVTGLVPGPGLELMEALPRQPMAENADHVVIVTNTLQDISGEPLGADRWTRVALGLDAPTNPEERKVAAYHAPTRDLLADVGVEAADVVRIWDFTTRSDTAMVARLKEMVRQAQSTQTTVVIDQVLPSEKPGIDRILYGRLQGVPSFFDGEGIPTERDGTPSAAGTREVVFRAVLPIVTDHAPMPVLFGHGMGGDVNDGALDAEIAGEGMVKINLQFDGWSGADLLFSFSEMAGGVGGMSIVTQRHLQSITNAAAIRSALDGPLRAALETELGVEMDRQSRFYIGASLGGITGAVMLAAIDDLDHGVLNVPGGCWTQTILGSDFYTDYLRPLMLGNFDDLFEIHHVLAIGQTAMDEMDGAAWGGQLSDELILLQQSMGDPIVPNVSTEILARAMGADVVGAPLSADLNLEQVDTVEAIGVGLTQYQIASTEPFVVHGFAGTDTRGGAAAREQLYAMGQAVRNQQPKIILPVDCDPDCNFAR